MKKYILLVLAIIILLGGFLFWMNYYYIEWEEKEAFCKQKCDYFPEKRENKIDEQGKEIIVIENPLKVVCYDDCIDNFFLWWDIIRNK
jgi:uncharacterized membrane protein YqiK